MITLGKKIILLRMINRKRRRLFLSPADVAHLNFFARDARGEKLGAFLAVAVPPALPDAGEKMFQPGIVRTRA